MICTSRILVTLSLFIGASCHGAAPKHVVVSYLEAERDGASRLVDAWALLTAEDQAARPLADYITDHRRAGLVWSVMAAHTQFVVRRVHTKQDTASVTISALHPDPHGLVKMTPGMSTQSLAQASDPKAELRDALEKTLTTYDIARIDEQRIYQLQRHDEQWRVWLGLARQEAALDIARKAKDAAERGDKAQARQLWTEVLTMPRDPGGFVKALADQAAIAIGK